MMPSRLGLTALALGMALSGCATLQPALPEAEPRLLAQWPLPPSLPRPDAAAEPDAGTAVVADVGWRDFIDDDELAALVALALENNRDLRVALLNIERARAQYRIRRADRLPSIGLGAALARNGGSTGDSDRYSVELGLAEFELDLFGRVRSLGDAALQAYLATEATQRGIQLALIADVATAWLALGADRSLEAIADATLENYEAAFRLGEQRRELGAISGLELSQLRTQVETARAERARQRGFVAQGRNALALLAGAPVPDALLPEALDAAVPGAPALPAGLPSQLLLRRPDVQAAEHELRSANADIGAARAAFFPSIRLTASAGRASDELSGLFDAGTDTWSFVPRLNLPLFQGGRLRAELGVATADRDIALARYERAIQSGFREVADALALAVTLAEQRAAQQSLVDAAQRSLELSQARHDAGQDSYLLLLDAQRTLFGARQALVAARLAEHSNRFALYKALGGGWPSAESAP